MKNKLWFILTGLLSSWTQCFRIMMFLWLEPSPQFIFNKSCRLSAAEVEALDIFFKHTKSKTRLMRGNCPWRWTHDNDLQTLQFLIKSWMEIGNIILGVYASTSKNKYFALYTSVCSFGLSSKISINDFNLIVFKLACVVHASIHVCRHSGRHLVAFEKDFVISMPNCLPCAIQHHLMFQ